MMTRLLLLTSISVLSISACSESKKGPSPAYKTFRSVRGSTKIVFTTAEKLKITWRNMSGPAAKGTWEHVGDKIKTEYPDAKNYGSTKEEFVIRGECSLIRTVRTDTKGKLHEQPITYVLDEPRCRGRR